MLYYYYYCYAGHHNRRLGGRTFSSDLFSLEGRRVFDKYVRAGAQQWESFEKKNKQTSAAHAAIIIVIIKLTVHTRAEPW